MGSFLDFLFNARMHGGNTPPATPRMQMQLRGGREEGGQEVQGLARDGARWPCRRGDPTQPNQTVQVAGYALCAHDRRNRKDAETQRRRKEIVSFGVSLRLCVSAGSAIDFQPRVQMGGRS